MTEEANGNGGRVTIREVYALLEKVYSRIDKVQDSSATSHKDNLEAISKLDEKLDKHFREASVRDARITKLEDWREDLPTMCALRTKEIVAEEHDARHTKYVNELRDKEDIQLRRSGDASDDDHSGDRVAAGKESDPELGDIRRVWRIGKWVLLVVASWGALLGLNTLIGNHNTDDQTKLLQQQNAALHQQNKEILQYLHLVDPEHTPTPTPSTTQ